MKWLHKHLQAPAGALSTEKGSQVQKELFIIPSAIDEQTISPKTHEELLSLTRWLPTRPLRRVYSDYTNCIRRQEAN